jgi:hypothetical protein
MTTKQSAAARGQSGGNQGARNWDQLHDSTHPVTSIPPTAYAMSHDELEPFRSHGTPSDIGPLVLVVTPSRAEFVGFVVMEHIPLFRAMGCATVARALHVARGLRAKGRASLVLVLRGGDG